MRQLLPHAVDEVDPVVAYLAVDRPPPPDRPWVTVGMITTLDGASSVEGRSGGLGGPADQDILRAVRSTADVILVGAGTVRAEDYGTVRLRDSVRDARVAAGRSPEPPRLAIVSGRLDLDVASSVFTDASARPLVLTTDEADDQAMARLRAVADVHQCGSGTVDVGTALGVLRRSGVEVVVCEGGPSLNGALVADDLVDEWCLTVSPAIAGGDSGRIVTGAPPATRGHRLDSLLTADGLLFGRWVRDRH